MKENIEIGDLQTFHPHRVKRSHRKSRSGCLICKRRRIKCDETRPNCVKCQVRSLECAYVDRAAHASQRLSAAYTGAVSSHSSFSPRSGNELPLSPAGVQEAELAQHYLTHTMQTIASTSDREAVSDMWTVVVPSLAYTAAPVRRGMLALAALCLHFDHIGSDSPASPTKYREAAEAHGEIFVEASRRQLQLLQPLEVNSTLACSRLLCILGLAFYRIHRSNGVTFADEAGWRWLYLLRGVLTAYETVSSVGGVIDPLIAKDMIGKNALLDVGLNLSNTNGNLSFTHPVLQFIDQSQRQRFVALRSAINSIRVAYNDGKQDDLAAAVRSLREVTRQVCAGKVRSLTRAIYLWPVGVPKGFVEMLEQRQSLALAIYAHWLLLMVLLENIWWIDDMGRAGIREVLEICASSGPEISHLLEWPRRALDFRKVERSA